MEIDEQSTRLPPNASELASAVLLDRVVPVPAMLPASKGKRQKVTPRAARRLGDVDVHQMSEEDQRQMAQDHPLLNALAQSVAQRGQAKGQQGRSWGA